MIYRFLKWFIRDPKFKVISFDIFDTLIERKDISPLDVFIEVGKSVLGDADAFRFCYDRIRAEKKARTMRESGETTLDEIYDCLSDTYLEKKQSLKEAEELYEISNCYRKREIYKVFEAAKESGKRIIIISDMYLNRTVIEKMLHNCGYESYDALYISNEADASKRSGGLFKSVLSKEKIEGRNMLHIGDSLKADYLSARRHGISAVLIPRKDAIRRKIHEKSIGSKCR